MVTGTRFWCTVSADGSIRGQPAAEATKNDFATERTEK
jgi:hypothetical protein